MRRLDIHVVESQGLRVAAQSPDRRGRAQVPTGGQVGPPAEEQVCANDAHHRAIRVRSENPSGSPM